MKAREANMKRKIEKFKGLFLTIARSSVINWIIFLVLIIGLVFNLFGRGFYRMLSLFFALEVMFINANTYKLEDILQPADNETNQNYKENEE